MNSPDRGAAAETDDEAPLPGPPQCAASQPWLTSFIPLRRAARPASADASLALLAGAAVSPRRRPRFGCTSVPGRASLLPTPSGLPLLVPADARSRVF
ncbi:hypothetical protein CDD83_1647 [Cordyceps sp. RAO-2017]|nr:hypothetical protein CDD83_1647 [Cordyceps sp. RAO-2017]